ncbi:MAG: exodeoxyribonuclease V subunit beta [Desulfobacterales bacterium]
MKPFDPNTAPLSGTTLIEASAGTGKTYTIAGLFVRLVLEHDLAVDQILVVTYTTAATEELKTRIRSKLIQTRQALARGHSEDPFIGGLIAASLDPGAAAARLDGVLVDFDRAAIVTIHGFCQRLLHEHAFETGTVYDAELMTDPTIYTREAAEDFWRRNIYDAVPELAGFLLTEKKAGGPEVFRRLIDTAGIADLEVVPELAEPPLTHLDEYRRLWRRLVAKWPGARAPVVELLADPALNATIYGSLKSDRQASGLRPRDIKIAALTAAMDRLCAADAEGFPLFGGFEKFSRTGLLRATKKTCSTPEHPFFDLCDRLHAVHAALTAEMERYFLYLKGAFLRDARVALAAKKKRHNRLFYEDLLLNVRAALQAQRPGGDELIRSVRRRFKAALVDEFQDTDAVQYEIFSRLFGRPPAILFLIGDPKQSIYGFRGADIFSYMAAAEQAATRCTLSENWRSGPGMIAAVNTLFSRVPRPFVYEEIGFAAARAGAGRQLAPAGAEPALTLWYLASRQAKAVAKSAATHQIAAAVGDEIARLTTTGAVPLPPADIAVLVRTNRQARQVKESLARRRIPSVLYGAGNIFETPEAAEILQVLTGVLDHGREDRFRAALATDLLGVAAAEIDPAAASEDHLEDRRMCFREYAHEWGRYGFMRMLRWLMVREGVRPRLLAYPDGDRRLTNLLHLAEILHQQSVREQTGRAGLLKWLTDQLDPETPRSDDHQLRLESDARAVRIVTTHRSKGLEYPVVFCPFGWEGSEIIATRDIMCHEKGPPRRRVLDLGSEQFARRRRLAEQELLAENLRLLYVALTRAKSRCYLVWGHIKTAETSALAYLLHRPPHDGDDIVTLLKTHLAGLSDEDRRADLGRLAAASGGSILVRDIPGEPAAAASAPIYAAAPRACRDFNGALAGDWRISSYSSLVAHRSQDAESPDRDAGWPRPPVGDAAYDAADPSAKSCTIFTFPTGARAGIFFHELFERIDFTETDSESLEAFIGARLSAHGFDTAWTATVRQTIDRVLSVALAPGIPGLVLKAIGPAQRRNEMEFYLPVKPVGPRRLRDIFTAHPAAGIPARFPAELEKLSFAPSRGFMKGYIDMTFCHEGRYYLIDWKSNHLGHRVADYDAQHLETAMNDDCYILQYCLYTVAFNRYLRLRDPAYRYESHFGGVFYIFIRGIDPDRGPVYGIYHDRPDADLIAALDRALVAGR